MDFYEVVKSFDVFGAQINFHIKSQKKYTSFCGGFTFLLYAILCPTYIIINLISFINRENISVIQYSKEIFETDEIAFNDKTSSFAIGLNCDKYDNSYGKLEELFDLQFNYISRIKINGTSKKTKYTLPLHKCTYNDFRKELKNYLDVNKITTDYYCPSERNHTIKGIITSEDFRFYELILVSNNDSKKDIYKDLTNRYDCKFHLYYTDVSIDVTNVTHPVDYYLSNIFIQLSSVYFKKVDAFFNIKNFKDDQNLFFNYPNETKFLTFVKIEQYDNYHGEDRFTTKYEDYKKYAKYFIKADKTKTIIERKCEKFPEFVASVTSILSGILLVLHLIIDWLNYSFATKNIIDTLCDEKKELLKRSIIFKKTLIIEKLFNDKQDSGLVKKIDDSKIKMSPLSQITFDELNNKSVKFKLSNDSIHRNYNINNFYFGLKKNNFINSNDGIGTANQLSSEIKTKNTNKLMDKSSLKSMEAKNDSEKNYRTSSNKIGSYEDNLKTKNKNSLLNYIIKESIVKFYLCKLFPFCFKLQKKVNNNYDVFLEKSLEQLITRLDIINYLRRIDQLEALFQILFKSSDFYLFNNFSKFNLNNVEGGVFRNFSNYCEQIYTNKFRNCYIQLFNNQKNTIFEERLGNLIEKEINEL